MVKRLVVVSTGVPMVRPKGVTVGNALQVSPAGNWTEKLLPVAVNWSAAGRLAGSLIVIELIAVVPGSVKDTAGTLELTLYHTVLATVGTVKLVEIRPDDE
jgi:hypothetical protein